MVMGAGSTARGMCIYFKRVSGNNFLVLPDSVVFKRYRKKVISYTVLKRYIS